MPTEHLPATSVAAIYDIHGNLPALEAVLAEIGRIGPERIVVGGDVAAGPFPRETIARLMELSESESRARFVRGNADLELVTSFDQLEREPEFTDAAGEELVWIAHQITRAQRNFLAGFAANVVLEVTELGAVRFCHGSPRSDEEIITRATSDERLGNILAEVSEPIIVCGHTHVQFDRRFGRQRIVNAGSVGMPHEGRPGAYWALLGPAVELRRTDYDIERAAELIGGSGYPQAATFVSKYLLNPPTAAEATEFFERVAHERASGL